MACLKRLQLINLLLVCIIFSQCGAKADKKNYKNTEAYDFADPKIINLPQTLDEISGISYYPKDTSVFAIIDEDGILFKIPLNHPADIKQWRFGKQRDYEDVVLKDSTFYVLVSNGDIEKLKFEGDNINVEKYDFPAASKKVSEFETLYFNPDSDKLVLMCKQCEEDKKSRITSFYINDTTKEYSIFSVTEAAPILEKMGVNKEHLKPSAAAINPLTKDLYILCSVNKLMIVQDAQGNVKEVIKLNPKIYKQPEGMAFTPQGDLIISNEVFLKVTVHYCS